MNMKRNNALLLVAMMIFANSIFAQFAGGSGTLSDPWQVANAEQLNSVRDFQTSCFIQTADIDLGIAPWNQGEGWVPIGNGNTAFTGCYNGANHSISGLFIDRPTSDNIGLFGYTQGSRIINLQLLEATVTGGNQTGAMFGTIDNASVIDRCHVSVVVDGLGTNTGGLLGRISNSSMVSNCSSSGTVNGVLYTGGLVGNVNSMSVVIGCHSNATIYGHQAGGLVGRQEGGSTIYGCYSTGDVSGQNYLGGLLGHSWNSLVSNSYSHGNVNGLNAVGGLIGDITGASVVNCYSTGSVTGTSSEGGLIGLGNSFPYSYWNTQTSGMETSSGGEGRTTEEMTYPYAVNTYLSWDFERIWANDTDYSHNNGYPYIIYVPNFITPIAIAPSAGNGSSSSPYQIGSLGNLYWITQDTSRWNKHYLQIADIDASQTYNWYNGGWVPIGSESTTFSGTYNGGVYAISGLYIDRPNQAYQGLFGYANGATLSNIRILDIEISGSTHVGSLAGRIDACSIMNCSSTGQLTGLNHAGGLIGSIYVSSTVNQCQSTMILNTYGGNTGGLIGYCVSSNIQDSHTDTQIYATDNNSGGLIGYAQTSNIMNCSSEASIQGVHQVGGIIGSSASSTVISCHGSSILTGQNDVGGLIGNNSGDSKIFACYTTGSVYGVTSVGGLVGYNTSLVSNSYSFTSVSGNGTYFGGLIGCNDSGVPVIDSYSYGTVTATGNGIGGLLGYGSAFRSYWNIQTSGMETSSGGEGRTTEEMTYPYAANTFHGWDFERIWASNNDNSHNNGFPYLIYSPNFINPVAIAPSDGNGSSSSPYQIGSLDNLYWVAADQSRWDKHYLQTADIDALQTFQWGTSGWLPIGNTSIAFTGSYNGNHHSISSLYINRPITDYVGLFGYTNGAQISNLNVTNARVTGREFVGALVGRSDNATMIESCFTSGSITGTYTNTGGMSGYNSIGSILSNCHSTGVIVGNYDSIGGLIGYNVGNSSVLCSDSDANVYGRNYIGGLVGLNESSSSIAYCSSSGSVNSTGVGAGGLVGYNHAGSVVSNSFSATEVLGVNHVGGLIGYSECTDKCFSIGAVNGISNVGGLLGSGSATGSYWNIQTSGQSTSSAGEGRTTAEMTYPYASNTYFNWDFTYLWTADSSASINGGYPYFSFEIELIAPSSIPPLLGSGTNASPYQINSLGNLYWITQDTSRWNKHYLQTADIDALQTFQWGTSGWPPIGNTSIAFTGSYNGNHHSISSLYINRPITDYVGLFGYTNGAQISNLNVTNARVTGREFVGALVGQSDNATMIESCFTSGSITGTYTNTGGMSGYNSNGSIVSNCHSTGVIVGNYDSIGGLIGYNVGNSSVLCSYSDANVYGRNYVGGLVGMNQSSSSISYCSSSGSVNSTGVGAGGLVGYNHAGSVVSNSFSATEVLGANQVGGLIGYSECSDKCFSIGAVNGISEVGGLLGSGNATGSYWNTQTSGQSTSTAGEGRTTAEMTYPYASNTYFNWDFSYLWTADSSSSVNGGYPYFSFEIELIAPSSIPPSLGIGTNASPYQINSLGNLYWIAADQSRWDKHYLQTADIDALQTFQWGTSGWLPIGNTSIAFTGSYNGNHHSISSLYINRPITDYVGLFGYTNGAQISNLNVTNARVTGREFVGALVGNSNSNTMIDNCFTSGSITGTHSVTGGMSGYNSNGSIVSNCHSTGVIVGNYDSIGGLIGYNVGNSSVLCSYSDANVYGRNYVGGLVGMNESSSSISYCSSSGSVNSTGVGAGGLVGYNHAGSVVSNSFSATEVLGVNHVGGLIGYSECTDKCFSIGAVNGISEVGGLLGGGSATGSYWNTQTSGQSTSSAGEGRTTAEMTYPYPPHSFVNWNWTDWVPDLGHLINGGYPYLHFQHTNYTAVPGVAISPSPANLATTITANTTLNWQGQVNESYTNLFTGFKLFLGTDNPPTNIVNGNDLGRVFSYDPNPDLAVNTTYYWKVKPYNSFGEAIDCPIWSFTTYDPVPELFYPNGTELWMSNTTQQIRWAPNAPPSVKLYISFNGGTTWNSIVTADGASGVYHYQVPAQSSNSCLIKITNALEETHQDISEANFSISTSTTLPKLMLSYPSASGLHLGVGLNANISWTRQNVSLVALDYSTDNGLSWIEIVNNLNGDSFNWLIPDSPCRVARIRVRSMQNSDVSDISDDSFRINKIMVTAPIPGVFLTGDHSGSRKHLITWDANFIDNVNIEYSANGGASWSVVINSTPAYPANYLWTIPSIPSKNALIRISNTANSEINDQCDTVFQVQNPVLIMNANGFGFATNTSLFNIRWHNQEIEPDRMLFWEYSTNNSAWTRINSTAVPVTDEYHTWYVDTGLQNNMWLRAVEMGSNYIVAKSESSFRITDKQLIIQSPAMGDTLGVESYTEIIWHAEGCTNLIMEYTTDFGQSWLNIASGIPSAQSSYLWQIPNTPSHQCRIRLRDISHSFMTKESEGEFSIVPFNFDAAFHAENTIGYADLVVQFYDDSIGYISSWAWDFNGDGITDSTEQNPVWIFKQSGFHSVSLTISDGESNSSVTRNNLIYVYPIIADFSASTLSGYLPLTVQFTDLTQTDISEYQWDFDLDGQVDSSAQDPIWTYLFPGTYSVCQQVSNDFESAIETKTNYISASLNPSTTLYVPTQYPTIQAAINAATDGAYIIIANGIYYENLVIEGKSITLASYYFVDGDSTHIANTIIDGSNAVNPDQASALSILPASGRIETQPYLIGFTIRNGSGRRIIENVGGATVEKRVGGGIYIRQSNPVFIKNNIQSNEADDEGGGSYAFQSVPNFGGEVNPAIGIVNPGGNSFYANNADIGADIYIYGSTTRDELKLEKCNFEVFSVADTTVSNYWANSSAPLSFVGCSGTKTALTTDLYVATNGSDTANTGISADSPFKTIDYALSRIFAKADAPLTIHIASGTYSPSLTGEKYPLQMVKHVSLQGAGNDETFLDAEASADFPCRVLNLDNVQGVTIADLTLMSGFVTMQKNYNGGGIGIINSEANLQNLLLVGSSSAGNGAGLYAFQSIVVADSISLEYNAALGSGGGVFSVQTNLELSHSKVLNNSANKNGAGISADSGIILIQNSEISHNQATGYQSKGGGISLSNAENALIRGNQIKSNNADLGAGIYLQNNANAGIDRNRITNNLADFNGGGMFINTTTGLISNNLIANNTASQRGGALYCYSAPEISNNTIVNNKATLQGGGLYQNSGSPDHLNTIYWGNVIGAANTPNQIYLYSDSADPNFSYCNVQGGSADFATANGISYNGIYQDNLDTDPLFIEPSEAAGNFYMVGVAAFTLQDASICIDSGDPNAETGLYPIDLAGNPRIDNTRIDIGAFETVHYNGAMISSNPAAIDFGRVNIHGLPPTTQLTITNAGNQEMQITSIEFELSGSIFTYETGLRSHQIAPGASLSLNLTFSPTAIGLQINNLIIHSNALNYPIFRIAISGYGIDASTSYPSNVQLQVVGDDVHLNWTPVLSDPYGNPYTPDGYVILFSTKASDAIEDYNFLGFTSAENYVHFGVARHRRSMFYRVVAFSEVEASTLAYLNYISREQRLLKWDEVKKAMNHSIFREE